MERNLYELTNPQKSILSIEQAYPETNINCIGGTVRIFEKVDFDLLKQAFNLTVKKNDGLRIRLLKKDDNTYQYFEAFEYEDYPVINITKKEFDEIVKNYIPKPFNIYENKLFNFKLYRFEDGTGAYITFLHHLICDAWTTSLYVNETMTLYHALKNNLSVDEITYPSYVDFIKSEQKYKESSRFQSDKEFWDSYFNDSYSFSSLKNNINLSSTHFTRKTFQFSEKLVGKLNEFCKTNESTIPAFLLSTYSLYFTKMLGSDSFTFGTPVLNRSNFAEKNMFGTFISTMPINILYDEEAGFNDRTSDLLKDQKTIYRHLKYPFSEVAKHVKEITNSSEKIYDVIFSYQNARSNVNELDIPFEITWIPTDNQLESLMIHVMDMNDSGNLNINYDYQTDIFSEDDIVNMHDRIERIIEQVLENNQIKCKEIEIVSQKEKQKLLHDFNNTECKFNRNSTIIDEFEKGVKEHPDVVAVSFKDTSYTYSELNNLANQLSKHLVKSGIEPNDIVGIYLPRSANIIISILAILKSGATYMPIEPEYPESRISFMIENSKAKAIISNNDLSKTIENKAHVLNIDNIELSVNNKCENNNIKKDPESLSYIMYTSGTTGVPKAVMIRNYSVLNFADCMRRRIDYSSSSENKVLSVTTMCFDIFVFEVFPTLLFGLHLVIANEEEQKSPVLLSKLIEEEKISKILTTPSRIQLLFLNSNYLECLKTLKEIILGGEPFPANFLHDLPEHTDARIFNLYGPTETTVYSTYKELTNENKITIGKPIENTTIYVLDKNKKLLPIGCHGELYIGGSGVAKGYYRNEELTNEKFIKNPYNEKEIIYNTGDLATWLPNGELLCFGRTDNQVKIRGYRIELGDIESHIEDIDGITKAVVLVKETSENKQYLCAYYTSEDDILPKEIHKHLVSQLPNYMVPSSYMKLDAFPLTPNHKVNRKALPEPTSFIATSEEYVAPSTESEKIICDVAQEILKVEKIGIDDDLFNYSADSLTIIQMQTLLIPYNMKFKTQDFYQLRTIRLLAELVDKENSNVDVSEEPDLYKLNKLIEKHDNIIEIKKKTKEQVYLLSGITGYLGIHLLHELLNTTDATIYCPIREKDNTSVDDRFDSHWNYYFPDEKYDENRVVLVKCDVTKPDFNITSKELEKLGNKVTAVLNCAANVKYYGDYRKHELINVTAVKNLIDFCIKFKLHLYHISTMGVSGNYLVKQSAPNTLFTENDFYIGQNYKENVYIHSKFEAEKEILLAKEKGLNYNIFRVGNLTARYSDGKFQKNVEDNAFNNILRFIARDEIIPKDMLDQTLEFTPVDLCAKAVVSLTSLENINHKTFNIFNEHFLPIESFLKMLKKDGIKVKKLDSKTFNQRIVELSQNDETKASLKAVVNDLDNKKGLAFMPSVILDNKITNKYLHRLSFEWPEISFDYIKKILSSIK